MNGPKRIAGMKTMPSGERSDHDARNEHRHAPSRSYRHTPAPRSGTGDGEATQGPDQRCSGNQQEKVDPVAGPLKAVCR